MKVALRLIFAALLLVLVAKAHWGARQHRGKDHKPTKRGQINGDFHSRFHNGPTKRLEAEMRLPPPRPDDIDEEDDDDDDDDEPPRSHKCGRHEIRLRGRCVKRRTLKKYRIIGGIILGMFSVAVLACIIVGCVCCFKKLRRWRRRRTEIRKMLKKGLNLEHKPGCTCKCFESPTVDTCCGPIKVGVDNFKQPQTETDHKTSYEFVNINSSQMVQSEVEYPKFETLNTSAANDFSEGLVNGENKGEEFYRKIKKWIYSDKGTCKEVNYKQI